MRLKNLDWKKMNDLIPAIIQDASTGSVLMLGYMNEEALKISMETKIVTFFSRSQNRLWTKGESSGNKLELIQIFPDCDNDCLLIHAKPTGPICHTGDNNCFKDESDWNFMNVLENTIQKRVESQAENSYTVKLLNSGLSRVAQKVGEEGVEVVMAAIEKNDEEFCGEAADLLFHLLVLLKARNLKFSNVIKVLKDRRK